MLELEIPQIMEKENISYRFLKNSHQRVKTGLTSKSLLLPTRTNSSQSRQRECAPLSQNVNEYRHLTRHPHLKGNFIKWANGLRRMDPLSQAGQETKQENVPSAFFKTTESNIIRLERTKSEQPKYFNSAEYSQIVSRDRAYSPTMGEGTMSYMIGLRNGRPEMHQKQKGFNTIPFKDKKKFPRLLKKEFIKKLRDIQDGDGESGFDGSQNFPAYSSKIVRERNYGVTSAFTLGRQKASLPGLAWQMGLRHY